MASVENIGLGIDIALTGMLVVFAALAGIAVAIALLPKVLRALEVVIGPERAHHSAVLAEAPQDDDEALLVAIGAVLARELEAKER